MDKDLIEKSFWGAFGLYACRIIVGKALIHYFESHIEKLVEKIADKVIEKLNTPPKEDDDAR